MKPRLFTLLTALSLLLCVGVGVLWVRSYVVNRVSSVEVVLPEGFTGLIHIKVDRPEGQTIKVRDGRLQYLIPANGVLAVQGSNPFLGNLESEIVRYAGGATLPISSPGNVPAATAIAAWPLLLEGTDIGYLIGTSKDLEEWKSKQSWRQPWVVQ